MNPASIGTASRSVLFHLSCIASEQVSTLHEAHTQDVLDRFKLWAGNIGALHADDDTYSLAHRLRYAPKLKSEIQRLLDELTEDIAELTTTLPVDKHKPAQIHPPSDGFDQDFDIATILAVIAESITSLLKISGLSRRTVERDQYTIALRRVSRDAVPSEASELETLTSVHRRLRSENLSWLRVRLAEANSQRRRFLRHREDHQSRIEAGDLQTAESSSRPKDTAIDAIGDLSEGRTQYSKSAASTAADVITSGAFAADLDEDVDSIYTYETETMGLERSRSISLQELVDEGEITDPAQGFICRYCKNEVFCARESAWRRHIMSDLRAYVCVTKSCELRLFDDSKAWFQHELDEHHTQRGCPYCSQTFPNREELKDHFRSRHADRINEQQLDQLAALDSHTPSHIYASACVFCDWTSKLRNQARFRNMDEVPVPLHRYRRHVGNHLEQAALAILPPLSGVSPSDDEDELPSDSDAEDFAHNLMSPRHEAKSSPENSTKQEAKQSAWGSSLSSAPSTAREATADIMPGAFINERQTLDRKSSISSLTNEVDESEIPQRRIKRDRRPSSLDIGINSRDAATSSQAFSPGLSDLPRIRREPCEDVAAHDSTRDTVPQSASFQASSASDGSPADVQVSAELNDVPTRTLLESALDCEDAASGLHRFREAVPNPANITAIVNEFFGISTVLREMQAAEGSQSRLPSFYHITDDLTLIRESIGLTTHDVFDMFARAHQRSEQTVWQDLQHQFTIVEGCSLIVRLQLYQSVLITLFEQLNGSDARDLNVLETDLRHLLVAQRRKRTWLDNNDALRPSNRPPSSDALRPLNWPPWPASPGDDSVAEEDLGSGPSVVTSTTAQHSHRTHSSGNVSNRPAINQTAGVGPDSGV